MPPVRLKVTCSVFPVAVLEHPGRRSTEATLKENAWGEPMCGLPSRLKRMRSIALASVTVPTVERGSAAHPLLVDE